VSVDMSRVATALIIVGLLRKQRQRVAIGSSGRCSRTVVNAKSGNVKMTFVVFIVGVR